MADASNPTRRVIDILNFLAAHPGDSFSLAEIARHLALSNGSAHRIVTALVEARFLSRHSTQRMIALGPALVAIGQAAIEQHRGIDIARRELAGLARDLNVQCSANAVVEDEVLVLIKEGTPRSQIGLTRVGERRPLIPPVGLCHLAWASHDRVARYCDSAAPHLSASVSQRLEEAFALIRERGYAIAANGSGSRMSREATVRPAGGPRDAAYWSAAFAMLAQLGPDEVQLRAIADAGANGVSSISAPVFSPAGDVALGLVMTGLPTDLSGAEIERLAERLCATAATITSEIRGRPPADVS